MRAISPAIAWAALAAALINARDRRPARPRRETGESGRAARLQGGGGPIRQAAWSNLINARSRRPERLAASLGPGNCVPSRAGRARTIWGRSADRFRRPCGRPDGYTC